MLWECSECGGCIERDRPPRQCAECGTAGVIFVGADPADAGETDAEVRASWLEAGMKWPPRWVIRGAVGALAGVTMLALATVAAGDARGPAPPTGPKPIVVAPKRPQAPPVPAPGP